MRSLIPEGFCPTDYFVPTRVYYKNEDGENSPKNESLKETQVLFYSFGFVAGCVWGDDSSWKIQFLDLSEAEKGIIKREEKFGYIELPDNQTLKEAIDMYDYGYDEEDYSNYIRINIMQTFDLRTGQKVE